AIRCCEPISTRQPTCCSLVSQSGRHSKLGAFGLRSEAGCAKPRLPSPESLLSFCTGCGSKAANSSGHQRRLLANLHSRTTEFPLTSGNQCPCRGRWRWCDRPCLCDARKEQNALHTLIHQRRLTPSCGGFAPTAERTMDPARIFTQSLTPRPELENRLGHQRPRGSKPHAYTRPLRPESDCRFKGSLL